MNADAITRDIMGEIVKLSEQTTKGLLINDDTGAKIEYAIGRSIGSIISGLSPVQADDPVAITEPMTEAGVPPAMRRELVRAAIQLGCSYYYLCSIYKQGYADAGSAGKGKPAELPETAPGQCVRCGERDGKHASYCNGRGVPTEQYTEGTPEEKIAKAKALLFEATREIRAREKLARANDRCKCGHRREEHAVSHSINYTEGYCMACPDVKGHSSCQWFHYAGPPQTATERVVIKEIARRLMA